jgi:hypothetical protein
MAPRPGIWSVLVHYPVLDREGGVVTTSVTNMDVHDLARTSRTYGLEKFIIVTPIDIHRDMVERVASLWQGEKYGRRTPSRREALEIVRTAASIDEAAAGVEKEAGAAPVLLGTAARRLDGAVSFEKIRGLMTSDTARPWLILFGTGWGLASPALERCDHVLEPVEGTGDYNHLSVRSAAAVILDRLTGVRPRV